MCCTVCQMKDLPLNITPFAVNLVIYKMHIHLHQQLKLYGKYTFMFVSLCKLYYCMSLIRNQLSYYAIDLLLVLMINYCMRLKVHLLCLTVQRCNCSSVDAIEC